MVSPSYAKKGKHDIIYLKNGSVINGQIISNAAGEVIRIKTRDNSLWVFKSSEIDSITYSSKKESSSNYFPGFFNLTELGILTGNHVNEYKAPFSLMNISGWQFKNRLSVGGGTGVEMMSESYLPVVADIRYHIQREGYHPFFGIQGGYSFALDKPDQQYVYSYSNVWRPAAQALKMSAIGGALVNPFVGINTSINDKLALNLSLGYRIMRHRYSREDNYKIDVDYNRLSVKIGLVFQ